MKKLFILISLTLVLCACSTNTQWEYKIVKVAGKPAELLPDYAPLVFSDQTPMLNKMGENGWELVNTYTEVSTTHPNFGNSEYVTGIRENTRTSVLNFIFKRPLGTKDKK